jgi:outer membrane protein TolC
MKANQFLSLLLALLISLPSFAVGSVIPEIWTARQAITFARQNNPDSQLAQQRMLQANALLQKAAVGFYPQVELTGS